MNRILTTIIALWSMCTMAGLPPTTLSGEQSATKPTTFTFEAPNYQGTQTSGIKSRVETGNTNLLVNPSFEHSTVTTGWTITNATATADTTNQVEGKKALSLALTGALSVVQDSTINAANLVGLQGNAGIKIKTSDVDGLKVCARNAGVTSTSLCINIPKDGVWKEINIPNILTATSNGIAITSTGTTGTVKLDDAFVGTSAPFQGVSGAKLVDTIKITGCAAAFNYTSTSYTDSSSTTGCIYTSSMGACSAPATNIAAFKCSNLQAGNYRIEYEGLVLNNNSGQTSYLQFSDGTNVAREESALYGANAVSTSSISQTISYSTSQSNIQFNLKGRTSPATTTSISNNAANPGVFRIWYFPPESKIYSDFNSGFAENAGEIFATAQTSCPVGTLPADGSAVSRTTYAELFKNIGTTYGVGDGSTTFNLPNTQGVFIRGAGSQTISSITYTGTQGTTQGDQIQGHQHFYYDNQSGSGSSGAAGTSSFRQLTTHGALQADGTNGTPRTGSETRPANISALYCIRAYNKNIVGSFAGIEKCANDYECTDTFSAQVSSTGVVSNENLDWINGNCTNGSTGRYVCTINTNIKDGSSSLSSGMNCVATATVDTTGQSFNIQSTTTTISINSSQDGVSMINKAFALKCQKGTNDYKPKTAKVATSIGVPTVPGISTSGTGNSIDTFSVSYGTTNLSTACTTSPCFIKQTGSSNAVLSIVRNSTANYTLNTAKTYSDLQCTGSIKSSGTFGLVFGTAQATACTNCNSINFVTGNATTNVDSFGTINCIGSY